MSSAPRDVADTTWVLASANLGKLAEFRALFAEAGMQFASIAELGIDSPPETGSTFLENALIKARYAARMTGLPAMADDSGLVVDALRGEPGVRSARFAGEAASDDANLGLLLARLGETPDDARGARFHCVIVALARPDDPAPVIGHGIWEGRIARERRGEGGFGYDPVFVDPTLGMAAAELPPAVKNRISHRARALASLREQLRRNRV